MPRTWQVPGDDPVTPTGPSLSPVVKLVVHGPVVVTDTSGADKELGTEIEVCTVSLIAGQLYVPEHFPSHPDTSATTAIVDMPIHTLTIWNLQPAAAIIRSHRRMVDRIFRAVN